MDEKTRAAAQALQEVLERQAFVFADPAEGGEEARAPLLAASLRFAGAHAGGLAVAASLPLAREIAAGILGCDADDPLAETGAGDACKEIVNIACGQTLTALFGTAPVFDLGIPEVRLLSEDEAADWTASPEVVAFSVDGAPLFLRVDLDDPASGAAPASGDKAA
jgi:CheY-specific phosphatase CheX